MLEVVFEHCGLDRLDTLKLVCRLWHDLACAMPARWATASIAGHFGDDFAGMNLQFAVHLPGFGGLVVLDGAKARFQLYKIGADSPFRSIGQTAGWCLPQGLATDGTHIFVADYGSHRVLQLRISDGAVVDSIGKLGSGDGKLHNPVGLALVLGSGHDGTSSADGAVGSGDRLYVADSGNCRICVFAVSPLRFLTSIGKQGSAPLSFFRPRGLWRCTLAACTSPSRTINVSGYSRSAVNSCAHSASAVTPSALLFVRTEGSSSAAVAGLASS